MIAETVRRTIVEAKRKPKMIAPRSEESIIAQRDAHVRGLPGYSHGNVLDMSQPLGKRNLAKRQGAANMGGWTSEGVVFEATPGGVKGMADAIYRFCIWSGLSPDDARKEVKQYLQSKNATDQSVQYPSEHGLDDPSELGIEERNEAVRHLVRMIVREEIRVRK